MRLLVTGAGGQLGAYLLRELAGAPYPVCAWGRTPAEPRFGITPLPLDLADADPVADAFRQARPTAVLHAAALSSVAACQRDPAQARAVNAGATARLAELATAARARLVLVSTDLVFDGARGWYTERDPAAPLSEYGRSKEAAERAVLVAPHGVVARTSLLFGPTLCGRPAFFDQQVSALRNRQPIPCFTDEWRTPLSLRAAARALLTLAASDFEGVIHLAGPERLSRLEMARQLAGVLGLDASVLVPTARADVPAPEPRPRDTSLDTSLWRRVFAGPAGAPFEEELRGLLGV
jgi:dTDP-4-dehydrorhamnose reductase